MPIRFTDTNKWADTWFVELKAKEKLLFMYLCDVCDVAGFVEVSYRKFSFDLSIPQSDIQEAIKGLSKGLILSRCGDVALLKNFLKHQKNLPLNEFNNAHKGIFKKYEYYSAKFDNLMISNEIGIFILGAKEGLTSPTGKDKSNDKGNNIEKVKENFKNDLSEFVETYGKDLCNNFYLYWTELNQNKTKMRFQLQKTFEISKRLNTWANNENKFNKNEK
jgi:hypothetical protein